MNYSHRKIPVKANFFQSSSAARSSPQVFRKFFRQSLVYTLQKVLELFLVFVLQMALDYDSIPVLGTKIELVQQMTMIL